MAGSQAAQCKVHCGEAHHLGVNVIAIEGTVLQNRYL